jgi:uncharacterized membrane-anchored protein YhcB (DUF1043 family)
MIEYLPLVLTGIGIIVAIIYYTLTLRNANKTQQLQLETRQAQLFMNIYKELLSEHEIRSFNLIMDMEYDDFEDFEEKYGRENNPEANELIMSHLLQMEGFGVLIKEGYVTIRLVALLTSGTIKIGWEKLRNYIYEMRKRYNWPRYSIEYEYLYDTLMEYADKHPELQIK